jgi:Fe2+ transport protein
LNKGLAGSAVVALALVAAGCGGDDRGEVSGITATETTGTTATETTPAEAFEVPEGVAAQYATIEEEVAAEGGDTEEGEWRIAYIIEPAEGWFEQRGDRFEWRAPAESETNHIEILPMEAKTGRLVPDVPVTLEVLDEDGKAVQRKRLAFYQAEFFHYAENFSLPESGTYTLRATIGAPPFRRHGEEFDRPPLVEGVTVEFEDVEIETEEGG